VALDLGRAAPPQPVEDLVDEGTARGLRGRPDLRWRFEGHSLLTLASSEHTPLQVDAKLRMMSAVVDGIPPDAWERPGA
jgi:hypothetical protein